MSWILLGTIGATLFSSVGPVYYGGVTAGPDPFAPLMEYLRSVDAAAPLTALWAQDLLWQSYVNPAGARLGEGISAMPSMHVSIAVLTALIGFRVNRWVGWLYTAFALVIFLGSVHLAWHYALDGYVSLGGTLVIWWLAGRITMHAEIRRPAMDGVA
jgi:hypothetical protein